MIRIVAALAKRLPRISLCVISNSWSSWHFFIEIGLCATTVSDSSNKSAHVERDDHLLAVINMMYS